MSEVGLGAGAEAEAGAAAWPLPGGTPLLLRGIGAGLGNKRFGLSTAPILFALPALICASRSAMAPDI